MVNAGPMRVVDHRLVCTEFCPNWFTTLGHFGGFHSMEIVSAAVPFAVKRLVAEIRRWTDVDLLKCRQARIVPDTSIQSNAPTPGDISHRNTFDYINLVVL